MEQVEFTHIQTQNYSERNNWMGLFELVDRQEALISCIKERRISTRGYINNKILIKG